MSSPAEPLQRISRLTPLAKILSAIDASCVPARPFDTAPDEAIGAVLAADVAAPRNVPPVASALRDGWAVAWEQTADASAYAPVPLSPPPAWIETGEAMPAGMDAVLPVDAVEVKSGSAEISETATPLAGVLPEGADAKKGTILREAGSVVRPLDAAIFRGLGIESISVRAPRIKIVSASVPENGADTIAPLLAQAVQGRGCVAEIAQTRKLEDVFGESGNDAVIAIGGTGSGRKDASVSTLAGLGKIECHGFGISPGETAALGSVNASPVLLLPGRLDAALATFLVVGQHLLARLSGAAVSEGRNTAKLTKKVASTVGLAEIIFVRRTNEGAEPLGAGMFPQHILLQANGWILVAAESEGMAAGASVEVRELP